MENKQNNVGIAHVPAQEVGTKMDAVERMEFKSEALARPLLLFR